MSNRKTALLMAMAAAIQKSMGYQLDVSCTPIDFAKSLSYNEAVSRYVYRKVKT